MKTPPPLQPFRNYLLSSLPEPDIDRLRSRLQPIALKRNQTLHNAEERVETVYFLEQGVCSILSTMKNGLSIEVGIVGRDGFIGDSAILGVDYTLNRKVMQVAGSGYSIKARTLEEVCAEGAGELRRRLLRAVQGLLVQTAQTAACNRVHALEERLCRWLLMYRDRVDTDTVPITHEALAAMLGTRRSTVTLAVGTLQKAGSIRLARGNIKVENRAALEATACECYPVVRDEYIRLGLLAKVRLGAAGEDLSG
jgi:CRP-like cAMP-binding protein